MPAHDLPDRPDLDHRELEAVNAFLAAVAQGDRARAEEVLRTEPEIATTSLHVAAVLGRDAEVRRLIALDPAQVRVRLGTLSGDPLLWLCYSPFHGESPARDEGLAGAARTLLEAGADAHTVDGRYGIPALYAVTGVNNAPRIARILLEAGAEPNDGESLFHAAEHFHEEALELLLSYGAELNRTGGWGNTPLYFLLRHWDVAREPGVRQGLQWLLDHGADPNVRCGEEQENSLHIAARRGQSPEIVRLLLDHGAEVGARRGDGRAAWTLARRNGFEELVGLLEEHGAEPEAMSPVDELLAACGRGDGQSVRTLASPGLVASLDAADARLLPDAAARGRVNVVRACLAAGFPVDALDEHEATALHHAAIHGRAEMVRDLLRQGADFRIRDREHRSTAMGWACFGADYFADPDGDYAETVRALLEAGAGLRADEHQPTHPGVREVLRSHESEG